MDAVKCLMKPLENLSGIFYRFHSFFAKTLSVEKYLSSLNTIVEELLSLRLFVFVVEVSL